MYILILFIISIINKAFYNAILNIFECSSIHCKVFNKFVIIVSNEGQLVATSYYSSIPSKI